MAAVIHLREDGVGLHLHRLALYAHLARLVLGDLQDEGVDVFARPVYEQPAVMQFGQGSGKRKSESGTLAACDLVAGHLDLIEGFEYLFPVAVGDLRSVAVHPYPDLVVGSILGEDYVDLVLAVFDGIGDEVGQDLLYAVACADDLDGSFRHIEVQRDMALLDGCGEVLAGLAEYILEVLLRKIEFELLLLHFPKVEELVGKVQQARCVGLDGQHILLGAFLVSLAGDNLVDGHLDQGERRAYLVRQVREIAYLGVVDLFLLVVFHPLDLGLALYLPPPPDDVDEESKDHHGEEDIEDLCRESTEKRGYYPDVKGLVGLGTVVTDNPCGEGVMARLYARECRRALAGRPCQRRFPFFQ